MERLISGRQFSAEMQMCKACFPSQYIVDQVRYRITGTAVDFIPQFGLF
jgi:hypothetical protein